jgi:arylsulfatase A-like enzyme
VVDQSVRSIDVVPTVLDLAGLSIAEGLAGESLVPALAGARPFPVSALAEERAGGRDLVALRRAGWKWISGPRSAELYDLTEDALERVPVDGEPPAELKEEVSAFRARYPARDRPEIELPAATLEHLRSLGYVR